MLVLSRKSGQTVTIGENIRITIVKLDRHSVRLGIEAPGEIPIIRDEMVREETPRRLRSHAA
jgi:carbon storage regulator